MVFPAFPARRYGVCMINVIKSNERGHANHGWLDSYHSFSFADYYNPERVSYRTLRVINDDLIMPGMGFGTHPHRDMEIISYVLSGALQHKDSLGNGRVIRAGEFQYMSAGSGVQHSEYNPSKTEPTRLIQIWINPDQKGLKPGYAEKKLTTAETGKLHLVTSQSGRNDSIVIHQDADLWLGKLEAGQSVNHTPAPGRHVWLHVAEGEIVLNGKTLSGGDAAAVDHEAGLQISANKSSQVLLFDLN